MLSSNLTSKWNLGGGSDLVELNRKQVVVPVFSRGDEATVSVEGLMGQLQSVVRSTRDTNPDLSSYHLYDVALRIEQGELKAILDFRM